MRHSQAMETERCSSFFAGLPGTGKTTIAREGARQCRAVHLRIDSIEQAVRSADVLVSDGIGPAGYLVAYAVARDNLMLVQMVIVEVEVICSGPAEHQRQVEQRTIDVPGLSLPPRRRPFCAGVAAIEPWTGSPRARSVSAAASVSCRQGGALIGRQPSDEKGAALSNVFLTLT
jgi:hypothetical protein